MTYDDALYGAWAQDTESPSETEEREVVEAGRALDLETDSESVERDDIAALDYATMMDERRTEQSYAAHWHY